MCWYELTIKPRDVLFFRDAKPMEAASIGSGANWPLPNVLHDALFHALRDRWPGKQEWEFNHKHANKKDNRTDGDFENLRFGGLKTAGLFPARGNEIYLPCPSDLDNDGQLMNLNPKPCQSDLPEWIERVCLPDGKPGKKKRPAWISAFQWLEYAKGKPVCFEEKEPPLFYAESRPGIAIDPETGSVDIGNEEDGGKFYFAEYLRLADDVSLRGFATCESSLRGDVKADVLQKFFSGEQSVPFVFGGQRGIVQSTARREEKPFHRFFIQDAGTGDFLVKWVLLTPAVFSTGWRPDWVDAKGAVCLRTERPVRTSGQSREEWRKAMNESPEIKARLVAASIDKPLAFSGWNQRKGGPRPTMLAVPAGSVYWFKPETNEDALALVNALQGRCKSGFYGEKGFGLGICLQQKIEKEGETK
jgi:CRISPR type III-B/RAMP module-associated protein Cmr3